MDFKTLKSLQIPYEKNGEIVVGDVRQIDINGSAVWVSGRSFTITISDTVGAISSVSYSYKDSTGATKSGSITVSTTFDDVGVDESITVTAIETADTAQYTYSSTGSGTFDKNVSSTTIVGSRELRSYTVNITYDSTKATIKINGNDYTSGTDFVYTYGSGCMVSIVCNEVTGPNAYGYVIKRPSYEPVPLSTGSSIPVNGNTTRYTSGSYGLISSDWTVNYEFEEYFAIQIYGTSCLISGTITYSNSQVSTILLGYGLSLEYYAIGKATINMEARSVEIKTSTPGLVTTYGKLECEEYPYGWNKSISLINEFYGINPTFRADLSETSASGTFYHRAEWSNIMIDGADSRRYIQVNAVPGASFYVQFTKVYEDSKIYYHCYNKRIYFSKNKPAKLVYATASYRNGLAYVEDDTAYYSLGNNYTRQGSVSTPTSVSLSVVILTDTIRFVREESTTSIKLKYRTYDSSADSIVERTVAFNSNPPTITVLKQDRIDAGVGVTGNRDKCIGYQYSGTCGQWWWENVTSPSVCQNYISDPNALQLNTMFAYYSYWGDLHYGV